MCERLETDCGGTLRELELDFTVLAATFVVEQETPYALIAIPEHQAAQIAELFAVPIRRLYLSDSRLIDSHARTGISKAELVAAKLPDRGPVMSGDFGELLTALFLASSGESPTSVLDPKKWRLKQDRRMPAPHSDVVQFVMPAWPDVSDQDRVLCAEVKTKATNGTSTPIASAVADSRKDREGRLAKTLVWLRERAMNEDLGTVRIQDLSRFIDAIDHPTAVHEFRAVAVVSADLLESEIEEVVVPNPRECGLVVISVPDLKLCYENLFDAVVAQADSFQAGLNS